MQPLIAKLPVERTSSNLGPEKQNERLEQLELFVKNKLVRVATEHLIVLQTLLLFLETHMFVFQAHYSTCPVACLSAPTVKAISR